MLQTQKGAIGSECQTQDRGDPAELFATSAWQPHAIMKKHKHISAYKYALKWQGPCEQIYKRKSYSLELI